LKLKGLIQTLASESADQSKIIQDTEAKKTQQTTLRMNENGKYMKMQPESKEGIESLERAIAVINKATSTMSGAVGGADSKGGVAAVQLSHTDAEAATQAMSAVQSFLEKIPLDATLDTDHVSLLSEFVSSGDVTKYAPQSATIMGILTDMYTTFTKNLQDATIKEMVQNKEYEESTDIDDTAIAAANVINTLKLKNKAKRETELALATATYDSTTDQKKANIQFFDDMKVSCNTKHTEYVLRTKLRAEEKKGIEEALSVLTADSARASFGKSSSTRASAAASFMQRAMAQQPRRGRMINPNVHQVPDAGDEAARYFNGFDAGPSESGPADTEEERQNAFYQRGEQQMRQQYELQSEATNQHQVPVTEQDKEDAAASASWEADAKFFRDQNPGNSDSREMNLALRSMKKLGRGHAQSFLQVGEESDVQAVTQKAYKLIQSSASKSHSLRLAMLAVHTRTAKSGHFDVVITQIDNMVVTLKNEGIADKAKLDECKVELVKTHKKQKALQWEIKNEEAAIADDTRTIHGDNITILDSQAEINASVAFRAKITSDRNASHEQFKQERIDDTVAINLLTLSKAKLTAFYDAQKVSMGPMEGAAMMESAEPVFDRGDAAPDATLSKKDNNKGAKKAIISLMDYIIEDLKSEISEDTVDEKKSLIEYEESTKTAQDLEAGLQSKIGQSNSDITVQNTDITEITGVERTNEQKLQAQVDYEAGIRPDCDWMIKAFEPRAKARLQENDGLIEAKELLAGKMALLQSNKATVQEDTNVGDKLKNIRFLNVRV